MQDMQMQLDTGILFTSSMLCYLVRNYVLAEVVDSLSDT